MRSMVTGLAVVVVLSAWGLVSGDTVIKDLWSTHVEPVLSKHCWKCHGKAKQRSGLDLRTLAAIFKGGEHGPAMVPNIPEKSTLWMSVQPDAETHMPPSHDEPISDAEVAAIRRWIENLPTNHPTTNNKPDNFITA